MKHHWILFIPFANILFYTVRLINRANKTRQAFSFWLPAALKIVAFFVIIIGLRMALLPVTKSPVVYAIVATVQYYLVFLTIAWVFKKAGDRLPQVEVDGNPVSQAENSDELMHLSKAQKILLFIPIVNFFSSFYMFVRFCKKRMLSAGERLWIIIKAEVCGVLVWLLFMLLNRMFDTLQWNHASVVANFLMMYAVLMAISYVFMRQTVK